MESSNHGPSIGRVSSFGHYYRDELGRGEKRSRRKEVRQAEKRNWRKEVYEDAATEEGLPEVSEVPAEPSRAVLLGASGPDLLNVPETDQEPR